MKKISIIKNGSYIVQGGIPLNEKIIKPKGKGYILENGESLNQGEIYALCRCGNSKNPPFCDGTHSLIGFDGSENADKSDFAQRAKKIVGEQIDLLDDGRCALARFCHREKGDIWELVEAPHSQENLKEAIIAASECPAGRLVIIDKQGNILNQNYESEIDVLQDEQYNVSGPLAVKGRILLESEDGTIYPAQERYALCRCGHSNNKPFCDCSHVPYGFKDK